MKKLFLITNVLLIATNLVFAADYWVYIRKETKITDYNNAEQIAGRSDTGDIVEILPCTSQYVPTKKEEETYKIIKVIGLKNLDKLQLRDTIREDVIVEGTLPGEPDKIVQKVIKYRRNKVKLAELGTKEVFTKSEIQEKITDKIDSKSISFYTDK